MRVNFALEFPPKGYPNRNQYDIDANDPAVRYMITDEDQNAVHKNFKVTNVEDNNELNYKDTKTSVNENQRITETTTSKITRRTTSKSKVSFQLPEEYYQRVPELRKYIESFEQHYREVIKEEEDVIEENQKLKDMVNELYQGKNIESVTKINEEYQKYKEESEETIRKLRTKIQHFDEDQEDFAKSLKSKIRTLQKELDDKDEELQETKKKLNEVDVSNSKHDEKMKALKLQIEEKYKHFDELNRYINDLLKEKRKFVAQIDQYQRKIENLELDLKREGTKAPERVVHTERKVVDGASNEKLNEAKNVISNLERTIDTLRVEIKEKESIIKQKDNEIIQIKTHTKDSMTKTNELKTKETQVVKVQAKERLGEWGQVLSIVKTLATNYKGLLEEVNNERIHDNLDLEPKEQTGLGYSEPIFIILDKINKYYKEVKRLVKPQPTGELTPKDRKGLNDLKEIFQQTKTSTDYFVELLRTINKEKFVNFKHLEIDSEDIQLYLDGIHEYFSFHESYYKDIKEKINTKNAELLRLHNFEKEVLSGKNKAACLEDFKNISEKNNKLNKYLVDMMNKIAAQDLYKHEAHEFTKETNADNVLDAIYDQYDVANKNCKFITTHITELMDDIKQYKENEKNAKNNKVEIEKLKNILENTGKVSTEVKELLVLAKESLLLSEIRIDLESKNPDLYIESIENLQTKTISDIRNLKSLVKANQAELDQHRAFEADFKHGKMKDGSLNDFRFILGKVEKIRENVNELKVALKMEDAVFEVERMDYENGDDYIEAIGLSVKESNKDLGEIEGILRDYNTEVERLRIFEKEIREGKNKEFALKDFKEIYNKSRENLKGMFRNIEKAQNEPFNDNLSQIHGSEQTGKDVLTAIHSNMNKWETYNKTLERRIVDLNDENERLKRFEKDVKTGKNKEAATEDFKLLLKQNKTLYQEIKATYDKANNGQSQDELTIDISAKDPQLYIEAITKYHNASIKHVSELRDLLVKNNNELKRLKNFEESVLSGENKQGALKELKRLCGDIVETAKESKNNVEKAIDIKVYDMYEYDPDNPNPNYHIAYIDDSLGKLKRYNQNTSEGIDKLKEKLAKANEEKKKYEIDLEEYDEVIKRKDKEVVVLSQKLEKAEADAIDLDQFYTILQNGNKIIKNMNLLISESSGERLDDEVFYSESETNVQVLVRTLNSQIVLIDNKFEKLKGCIGSAGDKTNPIELIKLLNKVEEFKSKFREYHEIVINDDVEDPTNVDISQAKTADITINFINEDIDFLSNILDEFIDYNDSKINNLIARRNEILTEKEKIHALYTDALEDMNKKTMLIGSLQVKLFILMKQVELYDTKT